MTENSNIYKDQRLWKIILIISGIFSFAVCMLIVVNYLQVNSSDPVNTRVMNALLLRLNQHPEDLALRNEIREFDLLARKAYFTSQWQIRMGGYLFFIGIILTLIAVIKLDTLNKKIALVSSAATEKIAESHKKARKWIAITAVALCLLTLLLAFLTHRDLSNSLSAKLTANKKQQSCDSTQLSSVPIQQADSSNSSVINAAADTAAKLSSNEFPTAEMKKNFPSFRGAGGNGIAYQKNVPLSWDAATAKNIRWKTAISLPGYNSPVIWGDAVFLSGAEGLKQKVYCFELNTGKIRWTTDVKGIQGSPSKTPKVTDNTGFSAPSVCTDGEKVYAIFASGDIIALDMQGKKVWARNLGLPVNHYGYSSSLMWVDNKLIVQYDQGNAANLYALSCETGKTVWTTPRKVKISWASPVIVNTGKRTEILLIAEPYVASYDPATGKELWKIECTSGEVGPSVAYANGIVFALNEYAKLVAIQIGDQPKILWENNEYLSDVPSPVANNNYLIVVTSSGEVACYHPKTGEKYWSHDFGSPTYSSPVMVGDKVFLMDKKGCMHIFKADKTFVLLGEPKIGESSVCTPAFAEGKILIRAGNNLYCIGK
ncbi:MAG: PQQ-binding-like beta-propeller repeat protein [Bacteroidetes bacterium]|nr:PQQ-binding-like beta-propeller repeat protein [Bacteroidota bacterium]